MPVIDERLRSSFEVDPVVERGEPVLRVISRLVWLTFLSVTIAAPSSADDDRESVVSVAVEADVLAYAFDGFSGILRITFPNRWNVALGTGRYDVPDFIVEEQSTFDQAEWKATSESIQVLRVGYRFRGPMKPGPVVDGIVLNQLFVVESAVLAGETRFKQLGLGASGGYYFKLGSHFYLYPTASITYNDVYSGNNSVAGIEYEVDRVQWGASLHAGWEWGF